MKSEPGSYAIDDLKRDKKTFWDGVRNFEARNFMRDEMKVGDTVFFYHSNTTEPGIVGIARVCSAARPDETAFDTGDSHFDPKSKKEKPTWYAVDVCFVKKVKEPLTLTAMRADKKLAGMRLLQKGSRLSVVPLTKQLGAYMMRRMV